jgi:hypothetical protein
MRDALAMGTYLPGPPTSATTSNLNLNKPCLASGSMPSRYASREAGAVNFTPLPRLASSVSFFSAGSRPILGSCRMLRLDLFGLTIPLRGPLRRKLPRKSVSFRFQMQTIRLVNATFLIAKRKSMNWTESLSNHTLPALVGVCCLVISRRKRSRLFYDE